MNLFHFNRSITYGFEFLPILDTIQEWNSKFEKMIYEKKSIKRKCPTNFAGHEFEYREDLFDPHPAVQQ